MQLPETLRRATPERLKHDVRIRAFFVGTGLIPPRSMHSQEEAALLLRRTAGRTTVMEIGVYEGGSAALLAEHLTVDTDLHLVDPFGSHETALPAGWGALEGATRKVVERGGYHGLRRGGRPNVHWHVTRSEQLAQGWEWPIDVLFIDGDHSEEGVRRDWDGFHEHLTEDGVVLFHDSRLGQPSGRGLPGPTAVVDALFRGPDALPGWRIVEEVDRTTVVARAAAS